MDEHTSARVPTASIAIPVASSQFSTHEDHNLASLGSASPWLDGTSCLSESLGERSKDRNRVQENVVTVVAPAPKDVEQQADQTAHPHFRRRPTLVDWTGPDDPAKALNWTNKAKWTNIAIISSVAFLTPLASSMVAPAVPLITTELRATSDTMGSLIVSIYVLGYAIGPLALAPVSEVYGRLPVYHVCNFLFIIWTVACAIAPSVSSLLLFRLLAGIAGSCPLAIGGGSITDLMVQERRGVAMALYTLGPLIGPVIGPVAGGYCGESLGWRWVFWSIAIAGVIAFALSVGLMRETYEPVLLERKARLLRRETGNPDLRSRLDSGSGIWCHLKHAIVRPIKMLLFSPIVLALSIYTAVSYGYLYLLFTTLHVVFEQLYHFSQGIAGLSYLGLGIGAIGGLIIFGSISDRVVKKLAAGGEMKPEYRLPPLMPGSLLIPLGLLWYGWSAERHLPWIMPVIGTFWVGLGLIAVFLPAQTYLIDAFEMHAASAIAANTVMRSLLGAFLPLAGPQMYQSLGLGWANSLLAFIALALAPMSWILYKYGERLRQASRLSATPETNSPSGQKQA